MVTGCKGYEYMTDATIIDSVAHAMAAGAVVHQNHNPDCSTPQQALGDAFDIRDARNSGVAYWFVACRRCRLTWYLPRNPHKQTKDALAILRAHVQGHQS